MDLAVLASAPLNAYYVVSPVRPTATTPSLPNFATIPRISGPSLPSKSTGFVLRCDEVKLRGPSCAAGSGLGNTTAPTEVVKENDQERKGVDVNSRQLDDQKMKHHCEKLIQVFMVDKPTPTDWRRLLTFSKQWDKIGPHFYNRCQERADSESDPEMKHKLLRLSRKLKEIDVDIQRHNELLDTIRKSPSEVVKIVAKRRKDFTIEFFLHLLTVANSYYDNPTEQNAIVKLRNMCLASVQSYDIATESLGAINAAELKFQDIINSPSVDAACRKIDDLAKKNQLDSALAMMITKAWSDSKETHLVKDEVKDIMYHLYKTTVGSLQRLVPKDVRILKYLLTIKDPEERMIALNDAFTPGLELEGVDVDTLYTTPERLHTLIKNVVDAFHFGRKDTLVREAKDLVKPKLIKKLEVLKETIQDNFM